MARKCIHCDSYQNWRRHFGFSTTILSLLIALFAVIGQSVTTIRSAFHTKRAEIGFAVQNTTPGIVATLVFNDGDRSGTVSQGRLTLPDGRHFALMPRPDVVLIGPGSTALINYLALGDLGQPANLDAICKFALLVSDEQGLRSFDDQDVLCGTFMGLYPAWRYDDNGRPAPRSASQP